MDLKKLTTNDWIIGGSGIALLLFSFFSWFSVGGYGAVNGWHFFVTGIIPIFLVLACVAYVVLTRLVDGVNLPELPIPWALAVLGAAGLATLLIVIRLIIGYSVGGGSVGGFKVSSVKLDRSFGLLLSLLASIGVTVGAVLNYLGAEKTTNRSTGGGTGNTPPTPF